MRLRVVGSALPPTVARRVGIDGEGSTETRSYHTVANLSTAELKASRKDVFDNRIQIAPSGHSFMILLLAGGICKLRVEATRYEGDLNST